MAAADYVVSDESFPRLEWLVGVAQSDIDRRAEFDYSFGVGVSVIIPESDVDIEFTAWGRLVWEIEKQKKQLVLDLRRKTGASSYDSSGFETSNAAVVTFRYFFKKTMFADVGASFKLTELEGDDNTRITAFAKYRIKPFRGQRLRDLEFGAFAEYTSASAATDYTLILAGLSAEYSF